MYLRNPLKISTEKQKNNNSSVYDVHYIKNKE